MVFFFFLFSLSLLAFPFHCSVVLCQSDLQISHFSQKGNYSGRLKLGGREGGGQDSRQVAKGQGPKKKYK